MIRSNSSTNGTEIVIPSFWEYYGQRSLEAGCIISIENRFQKGYDMVIRTMTINDYDLVYSLWLNTPNMGLNNLDDSKDGISTYLKRNPNTCFVAVKDGGIIGVILSGHDGRRGFIYHLAVKQSEQRRGVGTTLVISAMSALEREGINKVALVVMSKNERGNAFWERLGFTTRSDLVYRNKAIAELTRIYT